MRHVVTVPEAERAAACQGRVTLNGKPAVVGGYREPFAHVSELGTGMGVEYAWETVIRIRAAGGAFTA